MEQCLRSWTDDKERTLIAFFSKHSCLWNHKSENYKNRQLRSKTLEHLRILLSAQPPPVPFTVEDIKNKFKNLRTTFQRQDKMVKASRASRADDVFVPQWKHYEQLLFLQDCWEHDDPPPSPLAVPQEDGQPVAVSFLPIKCYWTEERERELITFYSEHHCLWNKKSENHNNRQLRQRLLEAVSLRLSDRHVSLSVEDMKCKFKNLRTVFNREYKAVQASRASDKLYVSKWKHYQQLLFLCEACDEDDGPDELQMVTPQEDLDHGPRTLPSALNGFPSGSPSAPSADVDADGGAAYRLFLAASPDHLKLESQSPAAAALPASPDTKPCINPAADGRPSGDSRCHWNEAKVHQLISFYSAHICLWNHRSESYRNRLLRQNLLETLSNLLSDGESVPFTVEDIKTKFRNLRTIFQREHKAVSSNKTCGSEDFYLPKWKHYGELMFLCDSCDEDERPDRLRFHQPPPPPPALLHLDGHALTGLFQTAVKRPPPSPTPPDSRHSSPSSSPSTSSSHAGSGPSGRKRTSRRRPALSGEVLDVMRTLCRSRAPSPHAGFLKYVEECLNETPPDRVKKLKKKIIETIHSVSEDI